MNVVGHNLRKVRKSRGLTQTELAERCGIAQPTISDLERTGREPHYSTLRRLADGLGVEVTKLFEDPDGRPKVPQLPDTPLALLSPVAIDERLDTFDTRAKLDDLEGLDRDMGSEYASLSAWLREYRKAPQSERFARRADAELAKQRRAAVKLYRLAAFDRVSKIVDQRGVEFKTVGEIAFEIMEAQEIVQAVVESEEARERIEAAGETA
jgi:transcriptional regulator with XRE-family HTH domain